MRPTSLAVLASISLATVAAAQQPKPVSYLEQVAAAVSGYSSGGAVYVVICDTVAGFKIMGAYTTSEQAQQIAAAKRLEHLVCSVEGPYANQAMYAPMNTPVQKDTQMLYAALCKKGPDSDCLSDSTRAFIAPVGSIARVDLVYHLQDGRTVTESFDPRRVEAIFFTMPAVDRMLIPYDFRVYGFEGTVRRRNAIIAKLGGR